MGGTPRRALGIWLIAAGLAAGGCGAGSTTAPGGSAITRTVPSSSTGTSTPAVDPTPATTPPAPATVTVPEPTLVPRSTTSTTLPGPVAPGDRGEAVVRLQEAMAAAGFFRDAVDGVFGERTATAVIAVHKALDLPRTASWSAADWGALPAYAGPILPERPDEPDRLEIDLTRQLLYRLEGGVVIDVIPVSSGNGEPYENAVGRLVRARTPRGDFTFYKKYDGWRISYLGGLYRPWYFTGGYAIHGSSSVPAYPASHGCIRVPNWEADHLWGELWIGLPVHVWD